MEWTGEAIILGVRRYGEADAIIDVISEHQGRYRGFVKGGLSRRRKAMLQPGNSVKARWRARLDENLGSFYLEAGEVRAPLLFGDPNRLAALLSASSLLMDALPEREACAEIYRDLLALLTVLIDDSMDDLAWGRAYVLFEANLLKDMGYGLDLGACAATGEVENLIYVSPKSGRAVSAEAGEPYQEKLFILPAFLIGGEDSELGDIAAGLTLMDHFIRERIHIHRPDHRRDAISSDRERLSRHFEGKK